MIMKKFFVPIILAVTLAIIGLGSSCRSARLGPGGAYSGVSTNGVTNSVAQLAFFQADSAYDLAYSAIDAAFKFERDNRALLWKLSPDIKHVLDKIRPQASEINMRYLAARAAYIAYPTPAGLGELQTITDQLRQLSAAAVAVLPKH